MNADVPWHRPVEEKFTQYLSKCNLTEEAVTRTNIIINELHMLALIYESTNEQHRKVIDEKIARVQTAIVQKISNQSWLGYYLSRSNQVVTLEQVWKQVSLFKNEQRQVLINDICILKKYKYLD